jgi:hypothetical protein
LAEIDRLSVEGMHSNSWCSGADLNAEILRGDRNGDKESRYNRRGKRKSLDQCADWKDHSGVSEQSEAAPR